MSLHIFKDVNQNISGKPQNLITCICIIIGREYHASIIGEIASPQMLVPDR